MPAPFATYVNLAARELEAWLGTPASQAVAATNAEGPALLKVLRTPAGERTAADEALMGRVVAHIEAERERRPDGDPMDSPWRHGLMNWGHDPMTWSAAPPPATAVASPGRQAPDPRPAAPATDHKEHR